jgi:hypothetical protein
VEGRVGEGRARRLKPSLPYHPVNEAQKISSNKMSEYETRGADIPLQRLGENFSAGETGTSTSMGCERGVMTKCGNWEMHKKVSTTRRDIIQSLTRAKHIGITCHIIENNLIKNVAHATESRRVAPRER